MAAIHKSDLPNRSNITVCIGIEARITLPKKR